MKSPHVDFNGKADELLTQLEEAGVTGRLFGGLAVNRISPWIRLFGIERPQKDIDLIVSDDHRELILELLTEFDWILNQASLLFNEGRLIRADSSNGIHLDIYVDPLHLCHQIELGQRLFLSSKLLNITDLFLTKVQAAAPTQNDVNDIAALLFCMHIEQDSKLPKQISQFSFDSVRVQTILGKSWGFTYTVRSNLALVRNRLKSLVLIPPNAQVTISRNLELTEDLILGAKKTIGWQARSLIGTRLRWFDEL